MRHCSFVAALALVCSAGALAQPISFSNQTAGAGIAATHQPMYFDSFLAGGAVGDFNGDGFQDIFYPAGGGAPDCLYLNNGDGTFTDKAAEAGIALAHRSTAAAIADYNNDGRLDIFVTSLGPAGSNASGAHRLYRNDGNDVDGVPQFTDVAAAAGVNSSNGADGYGAAWGDYDLDGDLDLAVAGWYSGSHNRLFRNDGLGGLGHVTFTDVTSAAGLGALSGGMDGFAPRFADLDGDRYPELIWIGDFGTSLYFRNDGPDTEGDVSFTEITGSTGMGLDFNEMGQTIADFNRDGLFDVYVTTIGTNNLYINNGSHSFTNRAAASGSEFTGWGWGTVGIDFNHDTLTDIAAVTQSGRQWVYRNNGVSLGLPTFADVTAASGFNSTISGRGLSNLDIDNDGDQDLVIFPHNGPLTLFRNDLDQSAGDANWIRVFLDASGADAIAPGGVGSVVKVTIGAVTQMGRIDAGSNYLSQSELSAHFGLGDATSIDEIRVEWPDGQVTTLEDVPANQTMTIAAPADACVADLAEPLGQLDFSDVIAFLTAFAAMEPAADLGEPFGSFDFTDVVEFLIAFGEGCP